MSNGPSPSRAPDAAGTSGTPSGNGDSGNAPSGPRARLRVRSNSARSSLPTVRAVGQKLSPHEDFYHWVLSISWPTFFAWMTVAYLATNAVFALAFMAVPGCVTNVNGFLDSFFFSVETFATIGYGVMAPQSRYAHALVTIEALAGILATASITGVTFARLARPTAKILFSEKAVIATRDGVPHLQFRMANWRRNQIAEAQLHVMVLLVETTREGETLRRPTPLTLVRDKNPMFLLTWTAMHPIDADSPFYGPNAMEKLRAMNAEIFLVLTGLDETLGQTIHTRYRYQLDEIVHNARFADILSVRPDGTRIIDFDKFHDIETIDEGRAR
jgi:inward rectifier potassium channel